MQNILVVDDEQDLCEILKFNLELEQFAVTTASSGEEAVALLRTYTPDLILLDVMMGGMSGFEVASALKKNPATGSIPIIFVTAKDSEAHTVTGLELGADDYIAKPFSLKEVVARIRAVLRRAASPAPAAPAQIRYESMALDTSMKSLVIGGVPVPLTPTEYSILHLLLTNQGQLFSRQQLIARAWPDHVVVTDRTVDVNITRLRRKLGPYASNIVTRLGFGYTFRP